MPGIEHSNPGYQITCSRFLKTPSRRGSVTTARPRTQGSGGDGGVGGGAQLVIMQIIDLASFQGSSAPPTVNPITRPGARLMAPGWACRAQGHGTSPLSLAPTREKASGNKHSFDFDSSL